MKLFSTTALTVAVVLATAGAFAQGTKAPSADTRTTPACCMNSGAQMSQMDEHMQRMQTLHDKMASATTSEERQKLMTEQRQEMQQGMAMMQQMQHGGMMGGGMMGGAMGRPGATKGAGKSGSAGQKPGPTDQRTQMQMMEKRLDMMQMMMQSMMDQQGGMMSGTAPAASK